MSLAVAIVLLVLLIVQQVLAGIHGDRPARLRRYLNYAVAPLAVAFAGIVVAKMLSLVR